MPASPPLRRSGVLLATSTTLLGAVWLLGTVREAAGSQNEPAPPGIRFSDIREQAGIRFVHDNGRASGEFYYVEIMMAGVIFFDADRDGDPDLYFLNGRNLAAAPAEDAPRNAFYLNDGTGNFTDATAGSGLGDTGYSCGVCGGDYDNDGDIDLYVTTFDGFNRLFRNDRDAHFTEVAQQAGVEGVEGMPASCVFVDYDNDGWLDLYVANSADVTLANNQVCRAPLRDGSGLRRRYCEPRSYEPLVDTLYRNLGDGRFTDVTHQTGIAAVRGRSLGVAAADYDDDGDQDLFVACDLTQNLLYENLAGSGFREVALESGAGVSEQGRQQGGMGIASADYDGDERIDIAVSYFEKEWNGLYRNNGMLLFDNMAEAARTARSSLPFVGWGMELFDADLDGDLDWLVVNGHVKPDVSLFRQPVAGYEQPNVLYENVGDGRFEALMGRAGPGLEIEKVSRGLAVADIDGDGDLDAVVANLHAAPDLLRNDSPRADRHWLQVRTVGTLSNRDGIGARLVVSLPDRTLVRTVHSGQSYLSQSQLPVHFGLGPHTVVPKLSIHWPSGTTTVLQDVQADRVLEVVEPSPG